MEKRNLKADLEMCNKATPGPWVKDERGGCVAVYPRSIGEVNCMGESEGKRIFYKGGYKVLDKDGRFKHWEVYPQDIADAEFIAQAREGWPHAIERAIEAEAKLEKGKGKDLTDVNTGKGNSGIRNSGNGNSGHSNSGNGNSGYSNSGDWNSGDWNSGSKNSGHENSGHENSGHENSGNGNSGYSNSGDWNSGDWNSGIRNSGHENSGNWNSGNWNSGNWNQGDFCTGDFNISDHESGCFCTEEHKIRFFDQETDMTLDQWRNSVAYYLLCRIHFEPTRWVWSKDMTDKEKAAHPEYKTTGGYLKECNTDQAFLIWWDSLSQFERNIIKQIPNFNAEKFEQITGIRIDES